MTCNVVAGIDYSITGPAMCVHEGKDEFSIKNCTFLFLGGRKKYHREWEIAEGVVVHGLDVYTGNGLDVIRFQEHANNFIEFLDGYCGVDLVAIEGYAYGARGKVFNIGENTGILKLKVVEEMYPLEILQPGEIKKFATGKGTAKKIEMYGAWLLDTSIILEEIMVSNADAGPINDIVDSYFICKLAWENKYGNKGTEADS